jgi:uncharacterized protein
VRSHPAPRVAGLLFLLFGLLAAAWGQDLVPVPVLKARVTDLTGTLTPDQTARIEQKLAAFEARKGSQVVVLIVPTTKPEAIEAYSIRVAEQFAKLGYYRIAVLPFLDRRHPGSPAAIQRQ